MEKLNLNVGDTVFGFFRDNIRKGNVVEITKAGNIKVAFDKFTTLFTSDGWERVGHKSYERAHIEAISEANEARWRKQQINRLVASKLEALGKRAAAGKINITYTEYKAFETLVAKMMESA
jgi:hypothetical protein